MLEITTAGSFLGINLEVFEPGFLLGDDFIAKVVFELDPVLGCLTLSRNLVKIERF